MNLTEKVRDNIRIALKYNEIIRFLEGRSPYKIASDPHDRNSIHAYGFCLEEYHRFHQENKELGLDKMFSQAIIEKLQSDDCLPIDAYDIFKCLVIQLKLEKRDLAAFKVDNAELHSIFGLLKGRCEQFKMQLSKGTLDGCDAYTDGMYGYLREADEKLYTETGHKIL